MARPRIQIDFELVEKLAVIHCTDIEIASVVGVSLDTLHRRCADIIEKGKLKGRSTLRRKQFEAASNGNIVMLIWLGKQYLGQSDKLEQKSQVNVTENNIDDAQKRFDAAVNEEREYIESRASKPIPE